MGERVVGEHVVGELVVGELVVGEHIVGERIMGCGMSEFLSVGQCSNGGGNEGGVGWIKHSIISYVCHATCPIHRTICSCALCR